MAILTWLYAQVQPLPAGCRLTVCYQNLSPPVAKHLFESYHRPYSTWVSALSTWSTVVSSSSSPVIQELYSVCLMNTKNSRITDRTMTSSRPAVHSPYYRFSLHPWKKCYWLGKQYTSHGRMKGSNITSRFRKQLTTPSDVVRYISLAKPAFSQWMIDGDFPHPRYPGRHVKMGRLAQIRFLAKSPWERWAMLSCSCFYGNEKKKIWWCCCSRLLFTRWVGWNLSVTLRWIHQGRFWTIQRRTRSSPIRNCWDRSGMVFSCFLFLLFLSRTLLW